MLNEKPDQVEKIYKTSEMIAMLEKSPGLKFRRIALGDYCVTTDDEGYIAKNGRYTIRIHIDDKWLLVRKPATWQEAIQAF